MAAKKAKSRSRSPKRSVKDLSPRGKGKAVRGGRTSGLASLGTAGNYNPERPTILKSLKSADGSV